MNIVQPSAPVVDYKMSSSPWCKSISICPKENYVVVGFENSTVRFFKTTNSENPREDRLHPHHEDCRDCPPVDSLSFSNDGLVLLAGTRSPKSGTIQVYAWRFPFVNFIELSTCRYRVPLHESEDNGISSTIFRSGPGNEENLICISTWTQSGVPMLIQPEYNHRSEVRTELSSRQGRLGSRIQCAAFSPSGKELAMVNEKGHLYQISNLNSNPMDIRRIATSKELTAKSDSFAMAFMSLSDEEVIILAWVDTAKSVGYVKKIPMRFDVSALDVVVPIICADILV
jgi:WD40 repeat protein